MKKAIFLLFVTVLVLTILRVLPVWKGSSKKQENNIESYSPKIETKNFVTTINNKYFNLTPGTKYYFEKKTKGDLEKVEIEVTGEKRKVMGVETIVVRDRVFINGVLVEDTRDWYAQDTEGNVWYFGEDVDNYENGKVKDHKGAWEGGIGGALPGIIMKADPQVGDSYRQEYYRNEAEDYVRILAVNQQVKTSYNTFSGCIKTNELSYIDRDFNEYKYYCPDVGFIVLEESPGESDKLELKRVGDEQL